MEAIFEGSGLSGFTCRECGKYFSAPDWAFDLKKQRRQRKRYIELLRAHEQEHIHNQQSNNRRLS